MCVILEEMMGFSLDTNHIFVNFIIELEILINLIFCGIDNN